jgi:transposase
MRNVKLDDDEWLKIQDYLRTLPNLKLGSSRRTRRFIEAVVWIVRSGAQWRLLPQGYGNWNSVYKRFAGWCEAGIWQAMFAHFAHDPDRESLLLDSTVIRAHPCAAGAQKNG